MNEDTFNMEIRKFLKKVGVTSQREIEQAVHDALQRGQLSGKEKFAVSMTLEIPALNLPHRRRDRPRVGGSSAPGNAHVAEDNGLGLEVEIVALGLDGHGIDDGVLEPRRVVRMPAHHPLQIHRMFVAQA